MDTDQKEIWHQDPINWKWGIFYANKDDNRIIVPKRNKFLGWTLNMSNQKTYYLLLFFLLLFICMVIFIRKRGH